MPPWGCFGSSNPDRPCVTSAFFCAYASERPRRCVITPRVWTAPHRAGGRGPFVSRRAVTYGRDGTQGARRRAGWPYGGTGFGPGGVSEGDVPDRSAGRQRDPPAAHGRREIQARLSADDGRRRADVRGRPEDQR